MAKYKISEVYPEYVFQRLGAGYNVDAVDYKKQTYIDLSGQTVGAVQMLIARANRDKDVKFWQIEEEKPTE